ncbi:tautomerase family protein [Myxococcota bacterium]|nr:tautomerase family protein [Myxococcota bacterium]MBU1534480.1 tautomerase family protein [Myxococcota bacterium]
MPLTRVTCNFQPPPHFSEALHALLQETLHILPHDRLIVLDVHEATMIVPPTCAGRYLLFEISLFPGRTMETRRRLYGALCQLAEEFNVSATDTRIVLHEVPLENWGIRGGLPASEVALGYEVRV